MWCLLFMGCGQEPEPPAEAKTAPPAAKPAPAPAPAPAEAAEPEAIGQRLESFEPSLLANGSFEEGDDPPTGWQTMVAATSGPSETRSTLAWADGLHGERALRLSGDADTHRWSGAASEVVDVEPGGLYAVEGHMKTDSVTLEGEQADNSNLGLQFVDAEGGAVPVDGNAVVGTSPWSGTLEWSPVRAVVRAPEGAAGVRVLALHTKSGTAWFDALRLESVPEPNWSSAEARDFVFHWTEGTSFPEADQLRNGQILFTLRKNLKTFPKERLVVRRYASRDEKELLTGNDSDVHVKAGVIHTLHSIEAHGLVLALTDTWGSVDPWFQEGLAVAEAGWEGRPLSSWERKHRAELPSVEELVQADLDASSLPAVGSFTAFLVKAHGIDKLKQAATGSGTIRERLKATYNKSLAELQVGWAASLDAR